ncbi:hypothetical protein F2Q70_00043174 [Brassica cretica]|uniref:Uncharacterized protein n=1 Tax=Brassica cretica TaxID=69181 RepID=A0A8S9KFA1_BRACR|nr:hypothetical protein F2Q70_00043174 [Brassica cretica]
MTSRKRSSKKKTSPQSSSGNPCANEEIVHKEESEVEQEEKEVYWDALCGSITPPPEVFYPTRLATQLDPTLPSRTSPAYLKTIREFYKFRAGLCFKFWCMGRVRRIPGGILHMLRSFPDTLSHVNFLGVLILSYELGMDLSPEDFEGLLSTRKTSIDYSYRMAPKRHMSIIQGYTSNAKGWFERFFYVRIDGEYVEENCLPLFRGKWNFHCGTTVGNLVRIDTRRYLTHFFVANNILPAIPRDLFAKRDLLRNGPFFWDSFTLDRIRNAVALYRSRGISRPLRASDMDEPHPDAVPDQRERVSPRKDKGIALEDRNFVSEDLPLPGCNPGFTPGDGSGTSEAPLPDDFFANLPPESFSARVARSLGVSKSSLLLLRALVAPRGFLLLAFAVKVSTCFAREATSFPSSFDFFTAKANISFIWSSITAFVVTVDKFPAGVLSALALTEVPSCVCLSLSASIVIPA